MRSSLLGNPDIDLADIAEIRRKQRLIEADERRRSTLKAKTAAREGDPIKRPWPVVCGDGKAPPVFTLERDKSGRIIKVVQVRPFPRTDDDAGTWRGVRFDCTVDAENTNLGLGIQVGAGCQLDCMASVALSLHNSGRGRILVENRP